MNIEKRVHQALARHAQDKKLYLHAQAYRKAWDQSVADLSAKAMSELAKQETMLLEYLDALDNHSDLAGAHDGSWRWCDAARTWPDPLPNANQAYAYMQAMGWQVKRSTWYLKSKGEYLPDATGSWSQARLNEYANIHGLPQPGTPAASWTPPEARPSKAQRLGLDVSGDRSASLAEQLKEVRIRNVELDNENKAWKMDVEQGRYVLATEVYDQQFSLVAVVYAKIKNQLLLGVPRFIQAAGGDLATQPQVSQGLVDALDQAMREATRQESFQVMFAGLRSKNSEGEK